MGIYAYFVRKIIAPLWAIRDKSSHLQHLKYLEKSQYFPLEQIREIQWTKLSKLLKHSYENVAYYRNIFKEMNAYPQDFKSWDDFTKFPILTKDDVRNNLEALIAKNIERNNLFIKKTSGSTGVSLKLYWDLNSLYWKEACTIRHNRWSGWNIGEKVGAVWGNPEPSQSWKLWIRNASLERHFFLDTLKMDERNMMQFYHQLVRKKPVVLFGHAHSLYLLARFLRKNSLIPPKPWGIISTAMVLHSHERKLIESVFSSKVFNRYGCEEVSLIASECESHSGMHLNYDTLVVEALNNNKAVMHGEPGALILTDISNFGMPFLRYKVGDVGILHNKLCSCGRRLPLLRSIEGRSADYVVTPEGKYISGISLTENFAVNLPGIKQIQIIQDKIDHLTLRIVKSGNETNYPNPAMSKLFEDRFGKSMTFDVEYTEKIAQEKSGKYRFCISKIDNNFR